MSTLLSNINQAQNKKQLFMNELKDFIVSNNIVGTAAGVSIALVTKDAIQSLVGDIIIPGMVFVLLKLNIDIVTKYLPGKSNFDFSNFIKEFISWFLIVVITFLFVKFAFNTLLGVQIENTSSANETQTQNQTNESITTTIQQNGTEHFYGGMKYF